MTLHPLLQRMVTILVVVVVIGIIGSMGITLWWVIVLVQRWKMRTFLLMRGCTSTQKASQVIMHKVYSIDAKQIFYMCSNCFCINFLCQIIILFCRMDDRVWWVQNFCCKEWRWRGIHIFYISSFLFNFTSFSHWSQLLIHYSWFIKMIQTHLVSQSTLMWGLLKRVMVY